MAEFTQVQTKSRNFFVIRCNTGLRSSSEKEANEILTKLIVEYFDCEFRGVAFAKLAAVLEGGIDVRPTDGVIWVDTPRIRRSLSRQSQAASTPIGSMKRKTLLPTTREDFIRTVAESRKRSF